jgi:serine/threonine-protein kinase HipA
MTSRLQVYMDGTFCGHIQQSASGDIRFTYDEGYAARVDATPLSLSMPLSVLEHRKRSILPFLDGLITDNPAAREAIGREFDVSPKSPFAILQHTGADVAGALQIVPSPEEASDATLPGGGFDVLTESDVEAQLAAVVEEYRDGRAPDAGVGRFSLAGAQPKIALLRTTEHDWARPSGSTPTTHILKPVAGGFRRIDIVEHMTMRAAEFLGLDVASTSLREFGSIRAFVAERYDRVQVDGTWRRLHQEDLGQALGTPPARKYQREDGGPGVADVARLFRSLPRREDRHPAARSFFLGLMFNVAVEGTDAHIKNYSMLLEGNTARFAPLYDLTTYAPYKSDGQVTRSAMKVGGEYRFSAIGDEQCLSAARALGVETEDATEILRHIRSGLVNAFAEARDSITDIDDETSSFANDVLDSVSRLRRSVGD